MIVGIENNGPNDIEIEEIKCAKSLSCDRLDVDFQGTASVNIEKILCEESDSCDGCTVDNVDCNSLVEP